MKKLVYLVVLVLFSNFASSQEMEWNWSTTLHSNCENKAKSIVIDNQNNMYVLGYFSDTIVLGLDTLLSNTSTSLFLCKMSALGEVQWAKSFLTNCYVLSDIDVDSLGNLYFSMDYYGELFANGTVYENQSFIAKYDENGNLVWENEIESNANGTCARKIRVMNNNRIVFGGTYEQDFLFDTITRTAGTDRIISYVVEIDSAGNALGINIVGDDDFWAGVTGFTDIETDVLGYTILLHSTGNFDFGNGIVTPNGYGPMIIRFDNDGVCQWAAHEDFTATFADVSDFYADENGVYLTGLYLESFSFDTCVISHPLGFEAAMFVLKLNSDGRCLWLKSYSDYDTDYEMGYNISADMEKNIYVMGGFDGTAIIGEDTLVANGVSIDGLYDDIMICKFDSLGNPLWARNCGDMGGTNSGSIYTSNLGDIYFVGFSLEEADSKAEIKNGFIAKKDNPLPPFPAGIINGSENICDNQFHSFEIDPVLNANEYLWETPEGFTGTSNESSISLFVESGASSGYIIVTPINSNGEGDSAYLYVNVLSSPEIPTITFVSDTLFSSSPIGNQWYFNGEIISEATDSIFLPETNGEYFVQVSNGDCYSSSEIYSVVLSSIFNYKTEKPVIAPNPVTNNLTIVGEYLEKVVINDISGKKILIKEEIHSNNTIIDCSELNPGIYIISVYSKNNVNVSKIIKE
ncbi:MAG: T9SS type A sorting domain-containing protein [Bacteroidales bacterium]|nr:T9SS type A sorting domain-containing protein [Bacteroidales bacterium]